MNKLDVAARKSQRLNKNVLNVFILKFMASLKRQPARKSGIYAYPTVFKLLSALFSLNKREGWLFLRELQAAGLIKLIPAHGVRILAEVDENGRKVEGKD